MNLMRNTIQKRIDVDSFITTRSVEKIKINCL